MFLMKNMMDINSFKTKMKCHYMSVFMSRQLIKEIIFQVILVIPKTILNIENALLDIEVVNPNAPLTREEAIKKLKESKDLMELDMMSKEDYENLRIKLTPIIKQ